MVSTDLDSNTCPLVVIDLHLAWCGKCEIMEQNYRSLHMKYDSDYKFMQFFSCADNLVPEDVKASLTYGPLTCKPRIVIYQEGKKEEIDGADFTKLEAAVMKFMPMLDD